MIQALIFDLLIQGVQMTLVMVLAPLLTGVVRKVKARMQRRQGPPLLQPYRDLRRLAGKEVVLADNASWLFRVAPYLIFAVTWVAAALIPTFATGLMFSWSGDLIAITGAARRGALHAGAGRDGYRHQLRRHRFLARGDDRVTGRAGDADDRVSRGADRRLHPVVDHRGVMAHGQVGLRVSLALALVALVIVALAENARIPVDNPATHLELTMVHEAMVLEYSGRHLAMIDLAAFLKLLLYVSLIGCMFFPFGIARQRRRGWESDISVGHAGLPGEIGAGGVLLGVFEMSIAKMRVFRVPNFLGAAFMLGLLGVLLLFVSQGM